MSNEYIGAIAILIVSGLKMFGIELANDVVMGLVTGVVALWIAVKRYQKGDITLGGFRK